MGKRLLTILASLTITSAFALNPYAEKALSLMVTYNRDIQPSLSFLEKFENSYQLEALDILLRGRASDGQTYTISTKFPQLLYFNNAYSVLALRLMVEAGRDDINLSMPYLPKVSNSYQVDAIRILVRGRTNNQIYGISNKFPDLLAFNNVYAVQALELVVARGRDVQGYINQYTSISNPYQVGAIRALLEHDYRDGTAYSIALKFPTLLKVSNAYSLAAIQAVATAGMDVQNTLEYLVRVDSDEDLRAVSIFVRSGSDSTLKQGLADIVSKKPLQSGSDCQAPLVEKARSPEDDSLENPS